MALPGCASTAPRERLCFHQEESIESDIGYCQAVRVRSTLYVPGIAAQGEMAAAVRSVYSRLKQALEANGLSFADVVGENVFAKDVDACIDAKAIRKAFHATRFPSATWVEVQRLYSPSLVVEIDLIAEYPK